MDIIINGEKIAPAAGVATIGDALGDIASSFKGMLISSVRLDGRELDQQQLDEATAQTMNQPGRLEISMESTAVLAAEALDHAADVLSSDRRNYIDLAIDINVNGLDSAASQLNDFFGNWVSVQNALNQAASAVGVTVEQLSQLWQIDTASMIKTMTETLGLVQQALEARDSVAVADLLEYELAGSADNWIDTLTVLSQKFRSL